MQPRKHEDTKNARRRSGFQDAHRRSRWLRAVIAGLAGCAIVSLAGAQPAGTPATYKGLEISVAGVDRASTASLKDCPPGGNTVNATTRPGEEFAVVKVNFKVLPAFQASTVLKRPSITDTTDKPYNTAATFVDVGSVPEFSCTFPFRVPEGTKLKALRIEGASFDLSALEK